MPTPDPSRRELAGRQRSVPSGKRVAKRARLSGGGEQGLCGRTGGRAWEQGRGGALRTGRG